jgi:hypothetical protein
VKRFMLDVGFGHTVKSGKKACTGNAYVHVDKDHLVLTCAQCGAVLANSSNPIHVSADPEADVFERLDDIRMLITTPAGIFTRERVWIPRGEGYQSAYFFISADRRPVITAHDSLEQTYELSVQSFLVPQTPMLRTAIRLANEWLAEQKAKRGGTPK